MAAKSPEEPRRPVPDAEAASRRPYTCPRLVEYGSIAKLTQSQGSTLPEGGRPHMQPCL